MQARRGQRKDRLKLSNLKRKEVRAYSLGEVGSDASCIGATDCLSYVERAWQREADRPFVVFVVAGIIALLGRCNASLRILPRG